MNTNNIEEAAENKKSATMFYNGKKVKFENLSFDQIEYLIYSDKLIRIDNLLKKH